MEQVAPTKAEAIMRRFLVDLYEHAHADGNRGLAAAIDLVLSRADIASQESHHTDPDDCH